jgi:MtN3 and saliva related transmembrane protein
MSPISEAIGSIAALLTTASFVPQVLHTLRTRDTRAISLGMYAMFTTGVALWGVYGLLIGSWPVILANAVTLALASVVLWHKTEHKVRERRRKQDSGPGS